MASLDHNEFTLYMGGLYSIFMSTVMPEAGISDMDKYLHPTVFYGMQFLLRAWDTCSGLQSLHIEVWTWDTDSSGVTSAILDLSDLFP